MKKLTLLIRPTPDDGWVGGAIYFRNLVNSITQAAREDGVDLEIVLAYEERSHLPASDRLLSADLKRVFFSDYEDIPLTSAQKEQLMAIPAGPERRPFRQMLQYGALIRETGGDLIFPLFPIGDYRLPCPILSWIPDLQHAVLPEFFSPEEIEVRDRKYGIAAKASDAVILSSEAARDDFLQRYGTPSGRLEVLRFFTLPEEAWFQGDPVAVRKRLGIPDDYLMVCNQFWAHKNHQLVIRALSALKERGIAPFVVFTGSLAENRRGGIVDGVLQGLCEAGLWDQCRVLGQLDRVDQIQLVRGARAVVQPSLFEGWSTVLEDCRTLGKRVIASDLKVHREQDLPGATYFNPASPAALADEIASVLCEPVETSLSREGATRAEAGARTLDFGRQFLRLAREIARAGQ